MKTFWFKICTGCLVYLLFFTSTSTFSQDSSINNTFYQKSIGNALAAYHQSFGNQSALYNGIKYNEYPFIFTEGDPFFHSPKPAIGFVNYDDIKYDSVLMQYDEIKDAVVINEQGKKIQLHSKKVASFKLHNASFARLLKDSFPGSPISTAFYNVLYNGKIWLLKREVKTYRESMGDTKLLRFVDQKDYYYIKKGGQIFLIKNRNDFLNLFDDRKKELHQFIKANKLKFRSDRENMLSMATAYYDSLKK